VESLALADEKARLGLRIEQHVKLTADVIASVRARGLIGDKFVLLSPGASDQLIKPGDRIRDTESPPDLIDLISKVIGGDVISPKGDKKGEEQK
jgi:phospholipid/cholesterol/gamma-HCH transport system substrate-binding protein